MRLQNIGSRAAAIADDRRQHDGAVDVPPAAAAGRRRRRFENPPHVAGNAETRRRLRRIDHRLSELSDDIGFEGSGVHIAGVENGNGVRIVT